MDNIDFLKKLLTSGCEYWIAARREYVNRYGAIEAQADSVWIIAVPTKFNVYQEVDALLLKEVVELRSTYVSNIPISDNFPPFQFGISLADFHFGYPIRENIKEIVKKALELGSNNIYDYQKLLEQKEETQPA